MPTVPHPSRFTIQLTCWLPFHPNEVNSEKVQLPLAFTPGCHPRRVAEHPLPLGTVRLPETEIQGTSWICSNSSPQRKTERALYNEVGGFGVVVSVRPAAPEMQKDSPQHRRACEEPLGGDGSHRGTHPSCRTAWGGRPQCRNGCPSWQPDLARGSLVERTADWCCLPGRGTETCEGLKETFGGLWAPQGPEDRREQGPRHQQGK